MWMKNMFTAVAEIPLEDTFLGCSGNFGHQLLCWIGFNDNIGVGLPQGSRTCSNCFIGKELCTFNYEVMGFRPDERLNKATQQSLDALLERLSPAPALNLQVPIPLRYTPTIPASAGRKKISLKPQASPPSDLDGDRSAGKAFLTSCR